jgi:hypothetical protein
MVEFFSAANPSISGGCIMVRFGKGADVRRMIKEC